MSVPTFFRAPVPLPLATIAAEGAAQLPDGADLARRIEAAVPLDRAGACDVSVFHGGFTRDMLAATRAGACFVALRHLEIVPRATVALVTETPREAFARVAAMLHPASVRPGPIFERLGNIDPSAVIHAGAALEDGVGVDPRVVIGPHVEIGSGTFVGAGSVIGVGVKVGRGCAIDAGVSLSNALIGDRVTIYAGARIGQGGGKPGVPRLGRVILQNDVIIGANAVVERGDLRDTVIGEGSLVDALVAVAAGALVPRNASLFAAAGADALSVIG